MKKIFWTSIVWISILVLFVLYIKLIDNNMASNIAGFLSTETKIVEIDQSKDMEEVGLQLTKIQNKLEDVLQILGGNIENSITVSTGEISN